MKVAAFSVGIQCSDERGWEVVSRSGRMSDKYLLTVIFNLSNLFIIFIIYLFNHLNFYNYIVHNVKIINNNNKKCHGKEKKNNNNNK